MHRRRILELLSYQLITGLPGHAAKQDHVVIVGAGIIGTSLDRIALAPGLLAPYRPARFA
jgi:hypothetical protein